MGSLGGRGWVVVGVGLSREGGEGWWVWLGGRGHRILLQLKEI